ncbi:MAG: hypothetical protein HY529_03170 [Chloroflexi bacterium]|nr:hypothetical protein [Chloroflexota bacterium]
MTIYSLKQNKLPVKPEISRWDTKLPTPLLEGLENDYTALELERTPGAVAVSQQTQVPGEPTSSPGNSPETCGAAKQTHSLLGRGDASARCGSGAIFTDCENGHFHGKALLCGQDWCPDCGQDDSKAHNRRISAWLPKFQQLDVMGYLVIEFPDSYRHNEDYTYSRQGISRINRLVKDVLAGPRGKGNKRSGGYFTEGGLAKWHWFGDICTHCKFDGKNVSCKLTGLQCPKDKKKCENFENNGKFNPHINIAVRGGYLEDLEALKSELRVALDCPKLIVRYDYFDKVPQIYQKLKYITRPTFHKREWDYHFADILYNFRSSFWWGKWKSPKLWEVNPDMAAEGFEYVAELGSGYCPVEGCHAKLNKWSKPVSTKLMLSWGAEEIGKTGYYRIPVRVWSGDDFSPNKVRRLQELELMPKKNKKSLGGSYLPEAVVDARLAEFSRQHRRFVANWRNCTMVDIGDVDGMA